MTVTLPKALYWQPKLGSLGEVVTGLEDLAQCLVTILTTPTGAVPHRPDFGCDAWRYLDGPVPKTLPALIRAVGEALRRWEPRVKVEKIQVQADPSAPHHRTLLITWAPLGSTITPLQTEVPL